jgi:hypothetical protein
MSESLVRGELEVSWTLVSRWSSKWKWVLSAHAFDAYNDSIAQKAASKRLIAEDQARGERWANRVHERQECAYNVFLDSHNDIGTYSKDVKAGKRRLIPKDKAALQTAFVRLDIRAEAAVDKVMAQRATANQPTGPGDDPGVISNEMTLAVLRTIVEYSSLNIVKHPH